MSEQEAREAYIDAINAAKAAGETLLSFNTVVEPERGAIGDIENDIDKYLEL